MSPTSPPRLCTRCGWTGKGRCPNCSGWNARDDIQRRRVPTSSTRWRRLRKQILREEPLCRACKVELAVEVDHIVPVGEGGHEFARSNLQPLCYDCHARKTQSEAQRARGGGGGCTPLGHGTSGTRPLTTRR